MGPNQAAPIGINLQANPGHATPRHILSRSLNNQDVEAARQRERDKNCVCCNFFSIFPLLLSFGVLTFIIIIYTFQGTFLSVMLLFLWFFTFVFIYIYSLLKYELP